MSNRIRIIAAIAIGLLAAQAGTLSAAETKLRPTQKISQQKLKQAKQLAADHKAGKLSKSDAQKYKAAVSRARKRIAGATNLTGGGNAGSCSCTATCQTIVFANGTEYEFEGTGTVGSPSACADAAEKFCGAAYSTWLKNWNCK